MNGLKKGIVLYSLDLESGGQMAEIVQLSCIDLPDGKHFRTV